MSTANESSPLLSKPPPKRNKHKCCAYSCSVNYRLPVITEKGAIVMIVCNVLTLTAIFSQLQRIYLMSLATVAFAVMAIIIFQLLELLLIHA